MENKIGRCSADILPLDEPTNHLDNLSVQCLMEYLKSLKTCTAIIARSIVILETCQLLSSAYQKSLSRRASSGAQHSADKLSLKSIERHSPPTPERLIKVRNSKILSPVDSQDLLTPKAGDTVTCMESKSKSNGLEFTMGRSARYQSGGKVLLLLSPSEEEGMLKKWETRGIVVTKVKPNESKKQTIQTEIQAPMFQFPELKFFGQRAFISRWPERSIRARRSVACIAECFLYIGRGNHSTSTQGSAIPVEVIPVISGMMSTIVDNIDHTGYLNIGDSILLAAISREILTIKPLDGSEKGFNLSLEALLSWEARFTKAPLSRSVTRTNPEATSYLKAQNPEIGCCRSHIRRTWAILGNGNMTEALNLQAMTAKSTAAQPLYTLKLVDVSTRTAEPSSSSIKQLPATTQDGIHTRNYFHVSANPTCRKVAEEQSEIAKQHLGFGNVLIATTQDFQADPTASQTAALAFKN
ncbi:hypothetical protein H4Q26_012581 [Puccinia striiformis f. sp. tritici PST-130]|nr:hypothetical protein H4Q26_012581 [Puccinia striiformis f. sp. tritici PST-130]